jgi:hypothetical protein
MDVAVAHTRLAPSPTDLADTQESRRALRYPVRVDERVGDLAPGEACLLVQNGIPGSGFVIGDDATVGRHPMCDVVLDDITVSRRHAEFRRLGDVYQITDFGSLNGTYVNGERIDETTLAPGDELQIGKFRFVFLANL